MVKFWKWEDNYQLEEDVGKPRKPADSPAECVLVGSQEFQKIPEIMLF